MANDANEIAAIPEIHRQSDMEDVSGYARTTIRTKIQTGRVRPAFRTPDGTPFFFPEQSEQLRREREQSLHPRLRHPAIA